MTEFAGSVISEMRAQRDRAMARVKELESELAKTQRIAATAIRWHNDAEKAEAEVERLKEQLLDSRHWPHIVESIYDPMCVRCEGVNPSGEEAEPPYPSESDCTCASSDDFCPWHDLGSGGRESGDESTGNVPRRPGSAAANPAVRKERDDG